MAAMVAILDFPSEQFHKSFFLHISTSHPDASCQVSCQLAFHYRRRSENQIFKMAAMAAILDFPSEQFYKFFICTFLQVTEMLPTKFHANWPFIAGEEAKNIFQDGGHSGHLRFPIRMILAIFAPKDTLMLPTKIKSIGLLVQENKWKIDFQEPSWISDQKYFSYFLTTSHPNAS